MQKNYIINKFDLTFQIDQEAENMNIILDVDSGFRMATLPKMPIFIIELRNWYVDDKNGYRSWLRPNKPSYSFFRLVSNYNENHFIIIDIEQDKIVTKGSKPWINTWESADEVKESWLEFFSIQGHLL